MKYTLTTLLLITMAACSGKPTAGIESLQKVQAATRTGVNGTRYHDLVSEAAFQTNKACPDETTKEAPCVDLHMALRGYILDVNL